MYQGPLEQNSHMLSTISLGLYPIIILVLFVFVLGLFVIVIWTNRKDGEHVLQVAQAFATVIESLWPHRRQRPSDR